METTQQEIQDYLLGLNRTAQSWASTAGSERAKAKGIGNYLKWFSARNIAIRENRKTGLWEISASSQQEEGKLKDGQ